ncbi:GNAT family N-acetyltransferase [Falsirhodobacter deserti]|uniref:GNAT family N-acetyltransferase n=1 Tax=Falsirhodobacter deserti TaxID=1365611 RepID=UPI000FE3CD4B|nr:GNAT family N-acetyltransferase [Falsirhodobacter deserti]
MSTVIIRDATHDDADALLAVHQAAIGTLGREAYTEGECESWAFGLTSSGYVNSMDAGETFVAAICADTLAAFCSYMDNEIAGLFVHPQWSRQRVASKLLSTAEGRMRQSGVKKIILDAAASAVPFYQAAGYVIECQTPWRTRGGLSLSSYRMTKDC